MRYFIYCRKSTESDDRQALSIESQESEVRRAFLGRSDMEMVGIFREAYSAKAPGRTIFDDMLKRIERGEAEGIIAWHPDRLARNSLDGGRLIFLLDQGKLKDLKFANFSFENNPQGKFMLSIIFGYSKYYVDNLSQNVKRGNRAKVERGWRPGVVPLGYRNDKETRTIVPDGEHFEAVRRLFGLMLSGTQTVRSILRIANEDWGYRMPTSRRYKGRSLAQSTLYKIFGNPFYAGHFQWNGRLYLGKQSPVVTMEEFLRVQQLMGRPGTQKPQQYTFPFTGLIRCGACGLMITAEHKVNRHGSRYVYYHCTRHNRGVRCDQPSIEGRALELQFEDFIRRLSIDDATAVELTSRVAGAALSEQGASREPLDQEMKVLRVQLSTLTDLRVRSLIDDEDYLARKRDVEIALAAVADRRLGAVRHRDWIEPGQLLISFNNRAMSWFRSGTEAIKRQIVGAVGSNYTLTGKKLNGEAVKPFSLRVEQPTLLYWCGYADDIRTRFELGEPQLLTLIEKVRAIKAMVEAEDYTTDHRPREVDAQGASTVRAVRRTAPAHRQSTVPRHIPPAADAGTSRRQDQ